MQITITEIHVNKYGRTIGAQCGKTKGVVSVHRDGSCQVLCINAAHLAWKGGGKYMRSQAEALAAYRSPEMHAIINAGFQPITIPRRTSERTGDAIWMKFECGAGSRWTSTTDDCAGLPCNFSGCHLITRLRNKRAQLFYG